MQNYKWLAAAGIGLLGVSGILAACGADKNKPLENYAVQDDLSVRTDQGNVELTALADTEEQAQEIADLYQIELLSFADGVALYSTDQNPYELIALGQEKDYPPLSLNQIKQLY
ncbi:MAG: hypothetical protein NC399_02460 [Muribaculum sp.]|nr:hypothetical protein [Muribaculum sp.]